MEYLSAIGPLLILMFFGGGLVIVAYLAFDDMRLRGVSWKAGSLSATVTSVTDRLKTVPIGSVIVAGVVLAGVIVIYVAAGSFQNTRGAAETATQESTPAEAAPAPATTAAATPAPAASAPAQPAAARPATNALASVASPGVVRTVTSASCASNGCPVSCGPDEVLASAYCVIGGAARLADQLQVKDGVMTAKCSASASSISVACARK
ncbi:hypothetical protein HUU61_19720 [Rhodopseudomonas palustris]|nr:hypothetical protein [Rhodopseudomonas palustris]